MFMVDGVRVVGWSGIYRVKGSWLEWDISGLGRKEALRVDRVGWNG